ncbi:MAG: ATP-dependent DNA helicase RecG [Clostridia bacterium]|nr:ATP-dependent DNA helicase RecG [Clostridia bacterium]
MVRLSNAPVKVLSGIGPARAKAYEKLGISTVSDLLYHFPRAYENRGAVKLLSECISGDKASVIMTIGTVPKKTMIRRGMVLLKFTAFDESGVCEITYYNQNYLADKFPLGATFRFYGQVEKVGKRYKMNSPAYEMVIEGEVLPPLVPVYPLTEGISKSRMATDIAAAMSALASELDDYLPDDIRREYRLCTLPFALRAIHDPTDYESVARAKRRLVFDEFFTFALGMALSGKKRKEFGAPVCDKNDISALLSAFPYELTGDQKKAIEEIKRDMAKDIPMSRILVGDVGCGKTVCDMAAMLVAVQSGKQAVLMAPTEILARQHYSDIAPVFEGLGYKTSLLVGSLSAGEKKKVRASLSSEDKGVRPDVVIGTHALISDGVEFYSAGVLVTDEQHRFGVAQRATLSKKGERAHVLVMSATPIPRSLALIMYGDLDLSKINEMPKGRQRVDTFVVDEGYRPRLNAFIEKQVNEGGQVYIVCPAVEEKEPEDSGEVELSSFGVEREEMPPLKAAVQFSDELSGALPNLKIAFLHGKMKGAEKDDIMKRFAQGEIDVLVSTTVIEVGVNVPRATLMIVENAERFGLAQLHQLRGRVGRGSRKSYCVLVSDSHGQNARERLETMKKEYDGFKIAEKDLVLRGPGDFIKGSSDPVVRQSGGLRFKLADMSEDSGVLSDAYEAAKSLLEKSPDLAENENLRGMIARMFSIDAYSLN